MKERLIYIDQMRGIAILLVIMGHLIQFNGLGTNNPVFEFIYSFHMPLFFAISGYIGFKTIRIYNLRSYIAFVGRKFRALMIPLLVWSLFVEKYVFTETWTVLSPLDFINVFFRPSLWFLSMLFYIFVLFGLLSWIDTKFNEKNILWIDFIFIMIFLVLVLLSYKCRISIVKPLYAIFFSLGIVISKHKKIENLIINPFVFEVCLVSFMILVCHWTFNGTETDDLYKIIISVSAFAVTFNACRKIKWNDRISRQLVDFGKYSLNIYITQFYLTKIFVNNNVTIADMNPFILFVACMSASIVVGYLCIGFAKIMELAPALNFLLYGKNYSRIICTLKNHE
jgi:fucose 4-O-acetylase-like acetyltransferase